MIRLLANENFPLTSVKILEKLGYDIKYIGIDNPGIPDTRVLNIAVSEQRTILTLDRDYGELIFKKSFRPQMRVIYLRLTDLKPEQPAKLLADLFKSDEIQFAGRLTVISEKTIRQRKYI